MRCKFRRGQDGEHWRVSLRLADGSGAGEADQEGLEGRQR